MAEKKRIRSPYCTNCGKVLQPVDNFCPNCGQENDNKRQSFSKVMLDLIQGFLSIDSRLAHSLPALLFRPGYLTKEYLRGRRQHYLDPVRMFITIVVIYFICASLGESVSFSDDNKTIADTINNAENQDRDTTININGVPLKINIGESRNEIITIDSTNTDDQELVLDDQHYQKIRAMVKRGKTETLEIMDSLNIENTFWNRFYYGEVIKFAQTDYDDFKDFLYSKLPWIIFFLMPVFAFLLKLLYLRRNFLYIDHLIFAFHLHSFLFLAGVIQITLEYFTGVDGTGWLLLAVAIYTLLAFKNFYSQSWKKTIFKLFLLWFMYAATAMVCLLFSMVIIFLIY